MERNQVKKEHKNRISPEHKQLCCMFLVAEKQCDLLFYIKIALVELLRSDFVCGYKYLDERMNNYHIIIKDAEDLSFWKEIRI